MKPKLSARQDLYSCEHTVNVRSGESQKGFKKETRKQTSWRLIEEKAREEKIARNFLLLPRIPAARLPNEAAGETPDLRHHRSVPVDGNKSRPGRTWCKDRRYRMKSGQGTCGDNRPPPDFTSRNTLESGLNTLGRCRTNTVWTHQRQRRDWAQIQTLSKGWGRNSGENPTNH